MRATDVMTPSVITVDPDTSVQDLAKLLSERNISGAPVVDKTGGMVGIVSEGDLLHRTELGTERHAQRRSWWLEHFASELARDYVKSHGRTVKDIMTHDVATVSEDTDLADIATLLETKRIKRVPVMRDGKVVGIVSRANLVRALAATTTDAPMPAADADDRAIRARLLTELEKQPWATKLWAQDVIVNNGGVHLWFGSDEPEERRQAARVAAENVPGVRSVEVHEVPVPLMPAF